MPWVDVGDGNVESRFFRSHGSELYTRIEWTTSSPSAAHGGNLARGHMVDTNGAFVSTWVSSTNGGCGTPRPLSCCE